MSEGNSEQNVGKVPVTGFSDFEGLCYAPIVNTTSTHFAFNG